ncbi:MULTISPECIES: class F sortase [unclassified Streptomyces]|uniref:class F sortase n=1 Tax=unclassified Streptomyces TaxID=2593676 RepID=UPI001660DFF9|nr:MULTISPECIES: class F sortase [unclassified Streptomyces]MBD0707090.1 class F sortase [Streptomyces sp. CBMA291]MBD0714273.1 class F sortase [Streptomyces sp. CBMA370]
MPAKDFRVVERRRRRPWGVLALAMLSGLAMMRNGVGLADGPPQPAAAARPAARPVVQPSAAVSDGLEPLTFAPASRIRIPAIRVAAPIMDVGLDPDGWVAAPPPEDTNLAGWYQNGVAPGQRGTSVVVGHVDNARGPAVFYALGSVEKGQHVEVERYDGRVAVFEVYGVEVYTKNDFPGLQVYADTGEPELRVITCGGGYTRAGGYDGNVVVYARMIASR